MKRSYAIFWGAMLSGIIPILILSVLMSLPLVTQGIIAAAILTGLLLWVLRW